MTMKTSIVIGGDSKGAVQAVEELKGGVVEAGNAARTASAPMQQLDAAQRQAATSARGVAQATGSAASAMGAAAGANRAATTAADAQASAYDELTRQLREQQQEITRLVTANEAAEQSMSQMATRIGTLEERLAGSKKGHVEAANGAAAHKAAMQNLSFQIQDVGAQLSTVSGPEGLMRIFAQQGGQIFSALGAMSQAGGGAAASLGEVGKASEDAGTDAADLGQSVVDVADKVENTGTKFGAVAGFLAGPWGAAILVAVSVLTPLVGKLFEADDAAEKAAKGGMELVDALDKQKYATDAAREAIKAYNEQQEKSRKQQQLTTQATIDQTAALIKKAEAQRLDTAAKIADRIAQSRDPNRAVSGSAPGVGTTFLNNIELAGLQADMKVQEEALKQLRQFQRNLVGDFASAEAKAAADPIAKINRQYDLIAQTARAAAAGNDQLTASLQKTLTLNEKKRQQALEDERERQRDANRKPEKVSLGDQLQREQAASALAYAQRYKGLNENDAGDRDQLRQLFRQANMNVDPKMVAWCAAFVNSVLAAGGIKGTDSLSARSFLNYGQATDDPNKGDIVVSRRGRNEAQGHVGFYQGTDAKGNILVLGGNTSDKVGTSTIARKDVLGFRRAPTAAEAYKDAEKEAQDALKEFQKDLEQVTAQYLPATAEAKKYADELARIDKLAKAYDPKKADSGLSADEAEAARKALATAHEKRLKEINATPEQKAAEDAKKAIDGVISSLGEELTARKALDPVTKAMAKHQDELNKLSGEARVKKEAELRAGYAQVEAYKEIEEATRAAAQAQRQFQDLALDAFDAIVVGGEKAGDVIDRLAQTIASAAIEATVFGTGPLAALLKAPGAGGKTAAPTAGTGAAGIAGQLVADQIGKTTGKSVGDRLDKLFGDKTSKAQLLQNAGYGYTAASVTGGNGIGGALGGALGGKAVSSLLGNLGGFAGPIGSVVGGILGGIVGNLFNKPKSGSAVITSVDTGAALGGNKEITAALSGSAKSIQSGIQKIADQLGGGVGAFNVSIGKREDYYRVDGNGSTRVSDKHPGSGLLYNGKDEAEAIAIAIANAIADGAVTGLSPRVQRAIQSTPDIDKALAEAVKVQNLELTMGGITAQIDKAFADFENQAKERVRIAQAYGFDVVAIEKKNGEDRAKLAEQLTKQQVGGLQKLIEEMTTGSLAEGTAMDKIAAVNTSIAKAKADLDAGVEGAGDTLASLYQQRLALSKEAYGTTSGYAADRAATLDEARTAIAKANARIVAASGGTTSDPALKTTNAAIAATNSALDENNDQNARMISALERSNELLASLANSSKGPYFTNLREMAAV
ncbi:TIGR02594 family protein [Sphingomonas paucimobilis]|uniref:TIGR02594 family protein n=1 Tax=Sphingomonas paucimobilis TaxID=13689 RepID=A0A7T3E6U4_SPHPI|nr:TIGR02594 family protein [Sphingomonas paucimobilis]QPT09719.1 TIGR02594 family protein [Sphingomonas paucimobilis]